MAAPSRPTTVCLTVVALVFIVVVIILCIIPPPCRPGDPRCKKERVHQDMRTGSLSGDVVTDSSTTSSSTTQPSLDRTSERTSVSSSTSTSTSTSSSTSTSTQSSTSASTTSSTSTSTQNSTSSSTSSVTTDRTPTTSETTSSSQSSSSIAATSQTTSSTSTTMSSSTSSSTSTTPLISSSTKISTTTEEEPTDDLTGDTDTTTDSFIGDTDTTTDSFTDDTDSIVDSFTDDTDSTTDMFTDYPDDTTDSVTDGDDSTINSFTTDASSTVTLSSTTVNDSSTTSMSTDTISSDIPADYDEESTTAETTTSSPATTISTTSSPSTTISTTSSPPTTISTTSSPPTTISTTLSPPTTISTVSPDNETTTTMTSICAPVTPEANICNTPTCKNFAKRMLHLMDHASDPCQDFFQYACGGAQDDPFLSVENPQQVADAIIKEKLLSLSPSTNTTGQLRVYYDSCIKYTEVFNEGDRLLMAKDLVNSIGYKLGITENFSEFNETTAEYVDLTEVLVMFMKFHFTPFFDVALDVDGGNSSKFALKITPPVFGSPFSNDLSRSTCLKMYMSSVNKAKINNSTLDLNEAYESYSLCMQKEAVAMMVMKNTESVENMTLGDHIGNSSVRKQLVAETLYKTNFFMDDFSKVLPSGQLFRIKTATKDYEEFTLAQLFNDDIFYTDIIDWKKFITELFGRDVDPSTKVQVYCKDELEEVLNLILGVTSAPSGDIELQNILLFLWSEKIYTDFVKPLGRTLGSQEYCFQATKFLLYDLVSCIYLDALPNQDFLKQQTEQMIEDYKQKAAEQLDRTFPSQPNNRLLKKLHNMTGETFDVATAEDILQTIENKMNLTDDFIDNTKVLLGRFRRNMYSLLDQSTDDKKVMWSQFTLPHSAEAVTSYGLNKFLIPYASLSPPFFYDQDIPAYVTHAGLGHLIAHEIMHGFDDTGKWYSGEKKEYLSDWDQYVTVSNCLKKQLNSPREVFEDGLHANFTLHEGLSINEVIADSAAVRLAWETYVDTVTRPRGTSEPLKKEEIKILSHSTPGRVNNSMPSVPKPSVPSPISPKRNRKGRRKGRPRNRRSNMVDTNDEETHSILPKQADKSDGLMTSVPDAEDLQRQKRQADYPVLPSTFSPEKSLPWIGLSPLQIYFLRTAQTQCRSSSSIYLLDFMEETHLPPYLRVNLVLGNEPLFAKAFSCPAGSPMVSENACPFTLG